VARQTFTPEPYSVFNEFDQQGLLLGLPRLREERNPEYKWRLLDVFIHRASSTYEGLIFGITRELGLKVIEAVEITPDPFLPMPAVVFKDTLCTLYSDFENDVVVDEFDRFEIDGGSYTLSELVANINATGSFTATLLDDANGEDRSMTIFNQTSVEIVPQEELAGKGARIKLEHENLIPGTIGITSSNLVERVYSEIELNSTGRYYIDLEAGLILTTVAPEPGSIIRYQWRNDQFVVKASPVIIHNLQSDNFKSKMFEQLDSETYGIPTPLGADIINELLTVFPSSWGT